MAAMVTNIDVRVYRPASMIVLLAWTACVVSFLLGLSGIASFTANATTVGVSGLVVAIAFCIFAIWYGKVILADRLVVTKDGLRFLYKLRRRSVPWSSVRAFEVGNSGSMIKWPAVVVRTDSGRLAINGTIGTRKRAEHIVAELSEVHRTYLDGSR